MTKAERAEKLKEWYDREVKRKAIHDKSYTLITKSGTVYKVRVDELKRQMGLSEKGVEKLNNLIEEWTIAHKGQRLTVRYAKQRLEEARDDLAAHKQGEQMLRNFGYDPGEFQKETGISIAEINNDGNWSTYTDEEGKVIYLFKLPKEEEGDKKDRIFRVVYRYKAKNLFWETASDDYWRGLWDKGVKGDKPKGGKKIDEEADESEVFGSIDLASYELD